MRLPVLPVVEPTGSVPKIVHLIWIGSQPGPAEFGAVRRWREALPEEYDLRFWTDESIADSPLGRVAEIAYSYGLGPRGVSDVLRIYAVGWQGGWYFDMDLVLIRPLPTDTTGVLYTNAEPGFEHRIAGCGAFGFTAGHPFLAEVARIGQRALDRGVRNDHFVFGPRTHHKAWEAVPVDAQFTCDSTCTQEDRRVQLAGGDFDLDRLRERSPNSVVVGIGLPFEAKRVER